MTSTTLIPPLNQQPVAADGSFSQAWSSYFQSVAAQGSAQIGTSSNDDAKPGVIGEYKTATSAGTTPLVTNVGANVTTLALSAGDWDVWGVVTFAGAATSVRQYVSGACSLSSGVLAGLPTGGGVATYVGSVTHEIGIYPIPQGRLSIAAPTTLYLVAQSGFATAAMAASGFIAGRRAR
jgi:hypothetical protein